MDTAIKFQNNINDLNIDCIEEYKNIFNQYKKGIFISNITDCKTRKHSLQERINGYSAQQKLNYSRFLEMENSYPFDLYIIDTLHHVFARLTIIKVYLNKNDIPKEELVLIPNSINNFYGYAFYKFIDLKQYSYESSNSIVNCNTKNPLFNALQINPCSPWRVEKIDGQLGEYLTNNSPELTTEDLLNQYSNFCVYRYYLDLPNCKMSYIGMTKNLQQRFQHHKNKGSWESKSEKNKYLYTAFKNPAIGYDKFHFEVLHDNLTEEEAHYWEAQEIKNFNTYFPFGFNVRNEDRYLK